MTNDIKEYWAKNHKADGRKEWRLSDIYVHCPRVECADGFTMSVQASYGHYCSPRNYVEDGDYSSWEIGFPSAREELIMPFVEDESDPTETVYGFVPTEIVNEVIRKHGGIKVAASA